LKVKEWAVHGISIPEKIGRELETWSDHIRRYRGVRMLTLTRDGKIATLAIDRAEKRNAITQAMWRRFPEIIAEIEQDSEIRVAVVTGSGPCFAAGADIAEFETAYATRASADSYLTDMMRAQNAVMRCARPTIAMIRGPCVGGGCGIALSCDIRYADPTARFGITPAKLGMVYTLGDTKRLVDAVGFGAAHEILLSGKLVDAVEAERIGLVNRVAPVDALEAAVRSLAELIAANAPTSLSGIKAILGMIRNGVVDDNDATRALFLDVLEKPDFIERSAAFREKRPPRS
jgi:enoyl-CoA hydratase/carnithine racemase